MKTWLKIRGGFIRSLEIGAFGLVLALSSSNVFSQGKLYVKEYNKPTPLDSGVTVKGCRDISKIESITYGSYHDSNIAAAQALCSKNCASFTGGGIVTKVTTSYGTSNSLYGDPVECCCYWDSDKTDIVTSRSDRRPSADCNGKKECDSCYNGLSYGTCLRTSKGLQPEYSREGILGNYIARFKAANKDKEAIKKFEVEVSRIGATEGANFDQLCAKLSEALKNSTAQSIEKKEQASSGFSIEECSSGPRFERTFGNGQVGKLANCTEKPSMIYKDGKPTGRCAIEKACCRIKSGTDERLLAITGGECGPGRTGGEYGSGGVKACNNRTVIDCLGETYPNSRISEDKVSGFETSERGN